MSGVARIEDGFAIVVPCHDGALIELQIADEEIPRQREKTWELHIAKGTRGTLDGFTEADLRRLAESIIQLADAIERSAV